MAGGVLFGPAAWDPVAITAQIVALQCLYYLSLGLLYKLIVGECAGNNHAAGRSRQRPHTAALPARRQPPLFPARTPATCRLPPAGPYVPSLTLYHFFDWRWVSFRSFQGWMVCVAAFTNAAIAALYLRFLVSTEPADTTACRLACRLE